MSNISKNQKNKRCQECGQGEIEPALKSGRTERYKTMAALPVPDDFPIPTCTVCGSEWMDAALAQSLDDALDRVYQKELSVRAKEAIETIAAHKTQRALEQLMGLSHGYLSKIRSGAKTPSAELVSHLALIAEDPIHRLADLDRFWASDRHPDQAA